MLGLAQAPSSPQTLYTVAWPKRLFVSADGGATWHPRQGLTVEGALDLTVDPHDEQTVYALGSYSLLRTQDGGRHWSPFGPESQYVLALALDGEDSHVLYAGTPSGLYRSPDGGDTWDLAAFADLPVLAVAGDPRNSAVLFAAVGIPDSTATTTTIWRSSDRGATWVARSTIDPQVSSTSSLPRFVFDPVQPGTMYAFFAGEPSLDPVFRSTDDGVSWVSLAAAVGVRDLAATPDGVLFAATDFGIAHSDDRGETWVPKLPMLSGSPASPRDAITRILVSTADAGGLIAAGSAGIWKSGPRGLRWNASNQGISTLNAYSLVVAPSGPPTVFALTGAGIFRSKDQGNAWTRLHSDLDWPYPTTIQAFDPRDPQTMYGIGTDGQADFVVESTNGGGDWRQLPVPFSCTGSVCQVGMNALTLDPEKPDVVYVAGSYSYHLGDSGDFLLRSDDGFATWKKLPPPGLANLVFAPGRNGAMYGMTCRRLLKSEDRARTWQGVGKGLPKNLCSGVGSVPPPAFDPRDPQRVYIATGSQGVFVSTDGGETFRPMNRGLEAAYITALLIDPKNPSRLYAATPARGVFQWSASLRKWTPLSQGLPLASFRGVLALDPQNPSILYAGTFNQGVFRLNVED
jgi:photosystem II stability/assembly factor-like uncharacterized protein